MVSDRVRTKLLHCCGPDPTPPSLNNLSEKSSITAPLDPGDIGTVNYGGVEEEKRKKQKQGGKMKEADPISEDPTTSYWEQEQEYWEPEQETT